MTDDETPEEFYSEERWNNWLDRLREEDIDPENEDSARLLLNLQDDAAIAVAKIVTAYDEGVLGEDPALDELEQFAAVVLGEVDIEDEDKAMLVDSVQMALHCVAAAAEMFVLDGAPEKGTVGANIDAAVEAEADEEFDTAFNYCAQAGTIIIAGADTDVSAIAADLEYGYVAEWVNGLDSLQDALSDPEVVEEDA
ncbi:DUF2150 family protein [Halosegnis marinus]|uniref:DUF2150 family protein n=1 Tax=Halosegnis marinus TaxID=3034023 RepID=A0ABD5ZK53_9EURY|nr:DUF2150 family protein [Halosegnis sp. DT85]